MLFWFQKAIECPLIDCEASLSLIEAKLMMIKIAYVKFKIKASLLIT